jgi:hypothetical protein
VESIGLDKNALQINLAEELPQHRPLMVFASGPRFQERCHPSRQYTRGLEDMTNASLQRGRQG